LKSLRSYIKGIEIEREWRKRGEYAASACDSMSEYRRVAE